MSLIIHRCIKRPGLIEGARTFYLELNNEGLHIICLGNATQEVPGSGNIAADIIAGKAINFIANRYEKKIREAEERIQKEGVSILSKEKKSYFLTPAQIEVFDFSVLNDGTIKINIKGGKAKLTLFAHQYYGRTLQNMKQTIRG